MYVDTYGRIDASTLAGCAGGMGRLRRVTASLPEPPLGDAMRVTGLGITETLVEGLRLVCRARALEKAMALRGKLHLDVDLERSRERNGR